MKEIIARFDDENQTAFVYGEEVGEIIRCMDCKHFEWNHWENVNGTPLIVAHGICTKWGDGCKTSKDGYCFLAERKEE